jgi:hypothetical protein
MKSIGIVTIILGALLLTGSLLYSPTVETGYPAYREVYNLGALQSQLMFWQAGLAAITTGCVLIAAGTLLERLEASGAIKPETKPGRRSVGEEISCEWCDQIVRSPNLPCSAVSSAQLRAALKDLRNETCLKALGERGTL